MRDEPPEKHPLTVYVDSARNKYGRMVLCHMLADTLAELHEMAERIGMRREWFQPLSSPHYDVSLTRRRAAIAYGAMPIDNRALVELIRIRRPYWTAEGKAE